MGPEFADLPADADDATRQDLAERLGPYVGTIRRQHPDIDAPHSDSPRGPRFVERTVRQATRELHNPAQLDVQQRLRVELDLSSRTEPT